MYTVNDIIIEILKAVEVNSYTTCTARNTETVTHEIIISDSDDEPIIHDIIRAFELKAKGSLRSQTYITDEEDDESFSGIVYEVWDRHGHELNVGIEE